MKATKRFRGFFQGEKGARTFNYLYSIGASIVIAGSLFKLLHWEGADLMLIVGMGTEAFIFFMSAFDEPAKEYKWENVFPVLDKADATPADAPSFATGTAVAGGGTVIIGDASAAAVRPAGEGDHAPAVAESLSPIAPALHAEQTDAMREATSKYIEQLNAISESLASMRSAMQGLDGTQNYAEQMQALNRNVQGLNTMYEIQLKSVSSQLGTIEQVNQGLNNIRSLYENGQNDSFRIRQETDQLARTLAQLNQVYARMLQAMTINAAFPTQPAQGYAAPQPNFSNPNPQQ